MATRPKGSARVRLLLRFIPDHFNQRASPPKKQPRKVRLDEPASPQKAKVCPVQQYRACSVHSGSIDILLFQKSSAGGPSHNDLPDAAANRLWLAELIACVGRGTTAKVSEGLGPGENGIRWEG